MLSEVYYWKAKKLTFSMMGRIIVVLHKYVKFEAVKGSYQKMITVS